MGGVTAAATASGLGAREVSGTPYDDPGQEVSRAGSGFVEALANVLVHLASPEANAANGNGARIQRVTRFHAVRASHLSVHDYLMRIATYFQCSHECFVLSLVYIDRIVKLHPEFTISTLNIHRLLVTSVMLSAKFFDDVYYSNAYYAKVGGVRTNELNALETLFLKLIEWRLHVLPEEYEEYRNYVLTAVQGGRTNGTGPDTGPTPYQTTAEQEAPWPAVASVAPSPALAAAGASAGLAAPPAGVGYSGGASGGVPRPGAGPGTLVSAAVAAAAPI